jgi:hypothetical protein
MSKYAAVLQDVTILPYNAFCVYKTAEGFYSHFKIGIIYPSFINNLRDSFIHFAKLYDSISSYSEEDKKEQEISIQHELMIEHINRGLIDTFVQLLQIVSTRICELINTLSAIIEHFTSQGEELKVRVDFYKNVLKKWRKYMHFFRNGTLGLRTNRMSLIRFVCRDEKDIDVSTDEGFKVYKDIFDNLQDFKIYTETIIKEEQDSYLHKTQSSIIESCWNEIFSEDAE